MLLRNSLLRWAYLDNASLKEENNGPWKLEFRSLLPGSASSPQDCVLFEDS